MIARTNRLLRPQQRNPALRLERLAGLIDDDYIKVFVSQLEPPRAVERSQYDFAPCDEIGYTSTLSLAVFLPQLFQVPVDLAAFFAAAGFFDGGLLGVHFGADVSDDGAGFGCCGEDVEGVV